MALNKKIELENGVVVNYHRIVSINKITNNTTIIEIASYINSEKRQQEKEALINGEAYNIYKETIYMNKEYDATEDIEILYNYLKTTEKFKDAENA